MTRVYKTEARSKRLISAYAAVSPEEGFAETFADYIRTPAAVAAKCPASCQCLGELLGY